MPVFMERQIFGCLEQQDQFQTLPTDVNMVPNIKPIWTNITILAHDMGGKKSIIS